MTRQDVQHSIDAVLSTSDSAKIAGVESPKSDVPDVPPTVEQVEAWRERKRRRIAVRTELAEARAKGLARRHAQKLARKTDRLK